VTSRKEVVVTHCFESFRRVVSVIGAGALGLVLSIIVPAAAHAQSPEAAPAGEAATAPAQVPPPADRDSFFKSITLFGIGDAYFVGNTNRPPDGDNLLRNFDTRANAVRLNYVEVALERKTSDQAAFGFRVDAGAGPTAKMVGAPEPGPDSLKYLQQAYVSARAPIGSGLTVDVGMFVTPAGAEVIETQDNWNYSRSLLFAWAIPYYHAGIRASYAINDKVSATGFVLNGWNNVKDNNGSKSVAGQLAVSPTSRVSIIGTWIGGAEQTDVAGWRNLVDAIVNVQLTDALKLQLNADIARDRGLGPGVGWHGVSAALRAELTPSWILSPRVEWFSDPQGASTGVAQDITEATLTVQRAIVAGLSARAEYRVDHSSVAFFPSRNDGARQWQQTIGVGLFYGWSSR
jgi:hypothetical protein